MQNIIEIANVSKSFTSAGWPWQKRITTHALRDINLTVKKGECVALLGPNGAGKTTLLKMISTLILPDSGTITVGGNLTGRNDEKIKSLIGLTMPEERSFYWRLTGRQNLECFAALYGLSSTNTRKKLRHLFNFFKVDYADRRFDAYSSGMKRKINLIRALLHDPEILLLDEPTKSLDYDSCCEMQEFIQQQSKCGKTIILATHAIPEAETSCTTFMILNKGKILGTGTKDALQKICNSASRHLSDIYRTAIKHA